MRRTLRGPRHRAGAEQCFVVIRGVLELPALGRGVEGARAERRCDADPDVYPADTKDSAGSCGDGDDGAVADRGACIGLTRAGASAKPSWTWWAITRSAVLGQGTAVLDRKPAGSCVEVVDLVPHIYCVGSAPNRTLISDG